MIETNDTIVAQEERPRPEGLRECQEIVKKSLLKQAEIDDLKKQAEEQANDKP